MFGNHRTSFLSGVVNMAILFLDVDGTLINYKAQIPSSAKEAVIAARKNGHFVFLCTGCSNRKYWKDILILNWMVLLEEMEIILKYKAQKYFINH